jgi:hypothetical protein
MSYIILRGCWCDVIVLNVYVPREDKINDMKDSFYEKLEHVFDKFAEDHMKILLGDFIAKLGGEDIFNPTIRTESLHKFSNDNGGGAMLGGFLVTTAWRVLRLRMEEEAPSSYGGKL